MSFGGNMKLNKIQSLLLLFGVFSSSGILTGCGQLVGMPSSSYVVAPYRNSGSFSEGASDWSAVDPLTNADYDCSKRNTIEPKFIVHELNTDTYTACANKTKTTEILLSGKPYIENGATQQRLCVFPVEIVDVRHVYPKWDFKTNAALSTCTAYSADGMHFDFPLTRYNAVIVVAESQRGAMSLCLGTGNTQACPEYSYGQFKEATLP